MEFITSFGGESDSGAKSSGNEGDHDGKKKRVRIDTEMMNYQGGPGCVARK